MGGTAVIAVNAGLVRAFVVQEMFYGVILIFFALQAGLWMMCHRRGRARGFWAGFVVSGLLTVLVMAACEYFPDSLLSRLLLRYTEAAMNLAFSELPTGLADYFDDHQDLLLAVVDFLPEITVALAGGVLGACANGRGESATERTEAG
jgi:hypothetical protein